MAEIGYTIFSIMLHFGTFQANIGFKKSEKIEMLYGEVSNGGSRHLKVSRLVGGNKLKCQIFSSNHSLTKKVFNFVSL